MFFIQVLQVDFLADFQFTLVYTGLLFLPPDVDAGPPAGALDPLAAFLKELEDLDSMSGPDIMAAIADLPVPQEGFVDGMAFQDAIEVGKSQDSAASRML